jgi:radical SAM superfamily enzyme YgiQ (UPF0313 family)
VGLLSLGAVLSGAGHEVRVLDSNAVHHRLTSEQVVEEALAFGPDVIGVTLLTPLAREAYRLAALLRPVGARLLAGGPHATLVPEEPLAHGFDAVAMGEGEPVAEAAVRALTGSVPMDSVPGFLWRAADGRIARTAPAPPPPVLDALPLPARHLANPAHYEPIRDVAVLFSSRGCPARCSYCAGGLFGKKLRYRSAGHVLRELQEIHRAHGARHFHFCDDSMSMDRKRMSAICEGIIAARLPITWSMMTRVDGVNEEMLGLAARSGCVAVDYGVESGCPSTLRRIRKPHTVEMVRHIVPLTRRLGIQPNVFFILGFPWESPADIEETRALMEELAPHVGRFHPAIGSVLVPFPCTEIYETYKGQFGFESWWVRDERNFDVPRIGTHSYAECVMFRHGAILDADFFRYSPEVKEKILEVFRFMHLTNLRSHGPLSRIARRLAFSVSCGLAGRWPGLERRRFGSLAGIAEALRLRGPQRAGARLPSPGGGAAEASAPAARAQPRQ